MASVVLGGIPPTPDESPEDWEAEFFDALEGKEGGM